MIWVVMGFVTIGYMLATTKAKEKEDEIHRTLTRILEER